MAYEIIPNAILLVAIAGVLGLFFRHVPEAVEAGMKDEQKKLAMASESADRIAEPVLNGKWYERDYPAVVKRSTAIVWKPIRKAGTVVGKKAWQFMLEAKDLKQGQILASKFARMVTPTALRYSNTAVHTPMSDADELVTAGRFDEAEQKYFAVLKKFPHEYTAYEGLVKIYLQQKQYDNLSETLEYLVRHVPENDSYWAQYGNVLMSTRQYAQAIPVLEKAVELNALIPARFVNLGLSYQATGDMLSAKANFQKASELEPSNIQYLVFLTDTMIQIDEKEKAIEVLMQAKEMLPDSEAEIEKQLDKVTKSN